MWIPRWLGKYYCKLYSEFDTREFKFEEALERLGIDEQRLRLILSNLRRSAFLDVLARRNRKRIYRLAEPSEVVFLQGKNIDLRRVPEVIRPILRSYLKELFDRYKDRIISVVLYGSFSRGVYNKRSDIDLLLVIDGYRWREPLHVQAAEELAYRQWELEGRYHTVQPYPLRPEQAKYHHPLYLDISMDGIILYDKNNFIKNILMEVGRKLAELGARRYSLPDGSWYWMLKPEVKEGEVVEI